MALVTLNLMFLTLYDLDCRNSCSLFCLSYLYYSSSSFFILILITYAFLLCRSYVPDLLLLLTYTVNGTYLLCNWLSIFHHFLSLLAKVFIEILDIGCDTTAVGRPITNFFTQNIERVLPLRLR